MKITIETANNGYIMKTDTEYCDDFEELVVFEDDEEGMEGCREQGLERMLRTIADQCGHSFSKHNKYELLIKTVSRSKWEDIMWGEDD